MTHETLPGSMPNNGRKRQPRRVWAGIVFAISLTAVVVESVFGLCASAVFDPIPNPSTLFLYGFTVAMLLVNEAVLGPNGGGRVGRYLGPVRRLALCVAGTAVGLFVALTAGYMFLPLTPFLVPLSVMGIGLLGLSPYFAALMLSFQLAALLRALRAEGAGPATGSRVLVGTGLLTLTAFAWLVVRPLAAAHHVRAALEGRGTPREREALNTLRFLRDESSLLDIAYHRRPSYWVALGYNGAKSYWLPYAGYQGTISNDEVKAARRAYFLLTGRPFEQAPRPQSARRRSPLDMRDDDVAVEETGGLLVGRRVEGVSLVHSEIDGDLDPQGGTGVVSWTLRFRNDSDAPQEARADIQIPYEATVHQASLWINGQEKQAAFGSPDRVRAAYQEVAVVQRRDPLLVTMPAPGHVLAQCFPVPAHGEMQIRIGVTTPLSRVRRRDGTTQLRFDPPAFGPVNFALPPTLLHRITLRGPDRIRNHWRAEAVFAPPAIPLNMPQGGAPFRESAAAGADLLFVLDASAGVNGKLAGDGGEAFRDALLKLPAGTRVRFVNTATYLSEDTGWQSPGTLRWRDVPWQRGFVGGTDPAAALAWAVDRQARAGRSAYAVVWLHGPSPFGVSDLSAVRKAWQREPSHLIDIPLTPGAPAGVFADLSGYRWVHTRRTLPDNPDELWRAVVEAPLAFQRGVETPPDPDPSPARRRLALHAATRDAWYLANALTGEDALSVRIRAGKRAAAEHLVTPLSSAVVLETREQYERNGLKDENAAEDNPAKSKAKPKNPMIAPEPGSLALLGFGSLIVLSFARRRLRKRWSSEA